MKKQDRVVYVALTELEFPETWKNGRKIDAVGLCSFCGWGDFVGECASRTWPGSCRKRIVAFPLPKERDCPQFGLVYVHEYVIDAVGLWLQGLVHDPNISG